MNMNKEIAFVKPLPPFSTQREERPWVDELVRVLAHDSDIRQLSGRGWSAV